MKHIVSAINLAVNTFIFEDGTSMKESVALHRDDATPPVHIYYVSALSASFRRCVRAMASMAAQKHRRGGRR